MEIHPLTPLHAHTAARLHIAGQPGTFLTSLGHDVLTVLYQTLPKSPVCFGFAALPGSTCTNPPLGFVSATLSIGKLLLEMGTRRIFQFLPPLLKRFAQQPTLALRSVQTILYPFLSSGHAGPDETNPTTQPQGNEPVIAELLSIMVEPDARSRGIGAALMNSLIDECQQRHVNLLDVTVDATNSGACRFYEHHGFSLHHEFQLYGRAMYSLRREIA